RPDPGLAAVSEPPATELVERPDLDAVLIDERNREIIDEFESEAKTRSLTGFWGGLVTALSVATTLFALYYAAAGAQIPGTRFVLVPLAPTAAQTLPPPHFFVLLFPPPPLVLPSLFSPPFPRFLKQVTIVDVALGVAAIAITAYVLINFE